MKYHVRLSEEERTMLLCVIKKGKESARKILHANLLLALDESKGKRPTHAAIAARYHTSDVTLHHVLRRYCEEGLESALNARRVAACADACEA